MASENLYDPKEMLKPAPTLVPCWDDVLINLSQAKGVLSLIAFDGEGQDYFSSHQDTLQAIYAAEQMIDNAIESLKEDAKVISVANLKKIQENTHNPVR